MRLDYDLEAKALYITVGGGDVARTVPFGESTFVDVRDDGWIAGIEVLGYDRPWPLEQVLSAFRVSDRHAESLRALAAAGFRGPALSVGG